MKRRDFNKLLAALPLAGALPFSFVKKAIADTPKPKRDPRIFYPEKQIQIHSATTNWQEPLFEGSQLTVYENDIFEPKIMSVSISTNFNLEQVFTCGQLEMYEKYMAPTEITTEIQVMYPDLRLVADFSFQTLGDGKMEWINPPQDGLQRYYAAEMVKVLQDGQSVLQFDPNKIPSNRWDHMKPVEILIDYSDNGKPLANLFIKEARLSSIQYSKMEGWENGMGN